MIDDVAAADTLGELDLFHGLSHEALAEVKAGVRVRSFPRGKRLFDQGQPTRRAHLLLAGGVRISQAGSDGGQVVIRFIGPGEIFGSVAIHTGQRYPADAVAMTDIVEASWSQSEWVTLVERHSRIAINMVTIVGGRLAELQDRVREMATQPAECRVAKTLLRLARATGRTTAAGVEISFPLRRKDIADVAGMTLHTVSRILTRWGKDGLIVSDHQQLTLTSVVDIERISEG